MLILKIFPHKKSTQDVEYQTLTDETLPLSVNKKWFGRLTVFLQVVSRWLPWNKPPHNSSDSADSQSLKKRTLALHKKQPDATIPAPVKIDFRFTRQTFNMLTFHQQFPCKGAEELAVMLDEAESMRTEGGLENILTQTFKIDSQNALFKSYVEKMQEQNYHITKKKGNPLGNLVAADQLSSVDEDNLLNLRTVRMKAAENITHNTKAVVAALGPQKEFDKIEVLTEQFQTQTISYADYAIKLNKLMATLNQKETGYRQIRYSKSPNVKETVNRWVKQVETFKRQQFSKGSNL